MISLMGFGIMRCDSHWKLNIRRLAVSENRSSGFVFAEVCVEVGFEWWQSQAEGLEDSLYSFRYQIDLFYF